MLLQRENQKNNKAFHRLGKMFVIDKSDKGQVFKVYKELLQLIRRLKKKNLSGQKLRTGTFQMKIHDWSINICEGN